MDFFFEKHPFYAYYSALSMPLIRLNPREGTGTIHHAEIFPLIGGADKNLDRKGPGRVDWAR